MYLIKYTAFLVLLLHQCIVNGFNIFDVDIGFNYLNREINSKSSSLAQDTEIKTRYILQEIDHFNSSDKREWQMKYFESLTYWKKNGPIYLMLGVNNMYWFKAGMMNKLAKETHGSMYGTVHRYYDDSRPFINLDAENIKYLSSRQTLADAAELIINLKSLPMNKNSKVVVIGNEYAAWMKVLYPKLIDAAISSSALVLAKKNVYEYLEKVKYNYEHYGGTECVINIEKKFENYEMLLQSPEGINQLKIDENICNECDMTVLENQQLFFFSKTVIFMIIATYGSTENIQKHCENLNILGDYRSFLNKNSINNSENGRCYSHDFNQLINDVLEERDLDLIYVILYQKCSEFGHFQTTTSKNQPFFNIPLEFYIKICSGLFGENYNEKKVDEGVEISNKLYGGLKPNVTKVIFTNGDRDPCSTISVMENLSDDVPAVLMPGQPRGRDLLEGDSKDSFELKEARNYVMSLIKKWIGASDHSN